MDNKQNDMFYTAEEIKDFLINKDHVCHLIIGENEQHYYCLYDDIPDIANFFSKLYDNPNMFFFDMTLEGDPLVCATHGLTLFPEFCSNDAISNFGQRFIKLKNSDELSTNFKLIDKNLSDEIAQEIYEERQALANQSNLADER